MRCREVNRPDDKAAAGTTIPGWLTTPAATEPHGFVEQIFSLVAALTLRTQLELLRLGFRLWRTEFAPAVATLDSLGPELVVLVQWLPLLCTGHQDRFEVQSVCLGEP